MLSEDNTERQKKRWGDRRDGKLVREMDGVHHIMPYLFPNRTDSEVYINEQIDMTALVEFLEKKNGEGAEFKTTPFHVIVAAVGKLIYHRPLLNRFVSGRRYYDRNRITLAFVVRRKITDVSEEMLLELPITGDTVLEEVSRKIIGDADDLKKGGGNDIGDALDFVKKFPRPLMRFVMWAVKVLDYFGKVPKALSAGDPNFSTVLLSNLGSIKCDAPYHHLNNYGTNSIVATIGVIHKEQVYNEEGIPEIRDVANIGLTLDERIADGFYFARSLKLLKYYLAHPEILERPVKEEVDYEY